MTYEGWLERSGPGLELQEAYVSVGHADEIRKWFAKPYCYPSVQKAFEVLI